VAADLTGKLSRKEREDIARWIAQHLDSAPDPIRSPLTAILEALVEERVPQKQFNQDWRQLGRALGFIPSSERRRSGKVLSGVGRGHKRRNQSQRELLEAEREHALALKERYDDLQEKQQEKIDKVNRKLRDLADEPDIDERRIIEEAPSVDEIELTEEQKAKNTRAAEEFVDALGKGDGADPALESANETLMCAGVVSTDEEQVFLPVDLPEDVRDEDVVTEQCNVHAASAVNPGNLSGSARSRMNFVISGSLLESKRNSGRLDFKA